MGGVVGFVGGLLAARLLTFVADFPMYFSWKAFAAGFGLSLLIGLIFGLQPASRAARVNPIDAIRNV
jgi:putative ABC transport system permease protein